MKKLRVALMATAIASTFVFAGCDKDDDNSTPRHTYELSGASSGSQVEPSNNSTATGSISGTYDSTTNVMAYTIAWTNLSATPTTAGFFSKVSGSSDINIGAAFTLGTSPVAASGSASGNVTLSQEEEAKLLAGSWYYVVRSSNYANGEIRGNVNTTIKNN
jgi:CHRD domain